MGVLCLPFKVDNLKEQIEGACTVLVENQDAVDTPILEHLHVLIGQLFAIHGSTREFPAADEVGLGVFGAAAAAVREKASARTHVRNASTDFLNVVFMVSSFLCENP